jgi:hypothetical protein
MLRSLRRFAYRLLGLHRWQEHGDATTGEWVWRRFNLDQDRWETKPMTEEEAHSAATSWATK